MKRVVNITSRHHYLIHVIHNDFVMVDVHCYSQAELDKKVTEICEDPSVHDFNIFVKIDFDLEEQQ